MSRVRGGPEQTLGAGLRRCRISGGSDHFLGEIAARYDGKPWVDFIDVGSFGVWGEGHTLYSSGRPYDFETVRRIIDLYRKNFPHTLLVCNDDFTLQRRGEALIDYCQDQGLTLRDDSILVGRDHKRLSERSAGAEVLAHASGNFGIAVL